MTLKFIKMTIHDLHYGIVFVIYSITSRLEDSEMEGIPSILCSSQKKEYSVGLFWTPHY